MVSVVMIVVTVERDFRVAMVSAVILVADDRRDDRRVAVVASSVVMTSRGLRGTDVRAAVLRDLSVFVRMSGA